MYLDSLGLAKESKKAMVSYIANKNGGTAEAAYDKSTGKVISVTVSINGIKETYNVSEDIEIINGRCVIDSQILRNDFDLSKKDATHQVGDSFNSIDDAAIAWWLSYNEESIAKNKEYRSVIYRDNGKFKYTKPNKGNKDTVRVNSKTKGKTIVAWIHSHAVYDANYSSEEFSFKDLENAENLNLPSYITTPKGYLIKYDPSILNSKIQDISSLMPKDINAF